MKIKQLANVFADLQNGMQFETICGLKVQFSAMHALGYEVKGYFRPTKLFVNALIL